MLIVWILCLDVLLPVAEPTEEIVYDGHQAGVVAIPSDIPINATVIILTENNLGSIPSRGFSDFTHVKDLNLSKCHLVHIAPDAFHGCPLEELQLFENQLASASELLCLEPIASTLWKLQIGANPMNIVTDPKWPVVASWLKKLTHFVASFMDSLGTCPDWTAFNGSLTVLKYQANGVSALPGECFLGFPNLATLYLQSNLLTFFPDFSSMDGGGKSLKTIYLYDNSITSITYDDLATLTSLQELRLANNRLSTFPDVRDSSILSLDLSGNPLVCDTRVAWMKEPSSVTLTLGEYPCVEPARLVGVAWADITADDLEPYTDDSELNTDPLFDSDNSTCVSTTSLAHPFEIARTVSQPLTVSVIGMHFRCGGDDLQFYVTQTNKTTCNDEKGLLMERCTLLASETGLPLAGTTLERAECHFECACFNLGSCSEGLIRRKPCTGAEGSSHVCEVVLR